jgi:AraC-like DNA-binding protein/ligand-binding sensor protein
MACQPTFPGKIQILPVVITAGAGVALRSIPARMRCRSTREAGSLDPSTAAQPAKETALVNQRLIRRLADSAFFREFQEAFEVSTRLPLTLRAVESWQLAHTESRNRNAFYALCSQSNLSCAASLRVQQQVCEAVRDEPCTMECAFGLKESAVGVKVGPNLVAYLQTGQVFFNPPSVRQAGRALTQLHEWGLDLDDAEAARCYHATPVVRQNEYEASLRLLQFFADQLGALASQIIMRRQTAEPMQITRARQYIADQHQDKLSLGAVAHHAGMSPFHFCKTFRKVTGVPLTEYISRVRVEEAKRLLLNPNFRPSEIGYQVGFQSLIHFNRVFKRIVGESPTAYRVHLPAA